MQEVIFRHKTAGRLQFDPQAGTKHFDPWWALLGADEGTTDFYRWLLRRHGLDTEPANKLWGPHVSVVKGQEPDDKMLWGSEFPPVEFWYTNQIRWNEKHAWLDVWSPEMSAVRERLGLPPKCFFHMTLGRLR